MLRALKVKAKHHLSPKFAYLRQFTIRPGDVVVDLGANVGEVCEYFLARKAAVHAYEPNPHAFAVLKERTGRNPRITLYPFAVSNYEGRADLWLHQQHRDSEVVYSQGGSLQKEKDNVGEDSLAVEVRHIRDVLNMHDRIRLLKIDIEGGEYDIMDEVLAQAGKIDHILLETHENKSTAFREKHEQMMAAIAASGHADKIYTDWF